MNSRSNFAVISLACLCLLNIWSSSESRSRRDTALDKVRAFLHDLEGRQLTNEQKKNILIMKTALSSLNKTLAEKQEMKPTSQPNEPTTRQSSDKVLAFLDDLMGRQLTDEQKNNIVIIKAALSSLKKTPAEKQEMKPTSQPNEPTTRQSSDKVWAFLDDLMGRQLTDEQKNNIVIIKAALSSLNKTLAEKPEMKPTSQPNEPTTRQSSSTAELSTKETSTTTAKTTPRSKTTTTKSEIASTSSTMKVASTQKTSTLKVKTTSKSTKATSQSNEMTTTQSSTTAELSTEKTLTATSTSKPTSKITKTDTDTDISKSSTKEAASTQQSSTSKVMVTEITTRKPSTKSVPHTRTSPTPERHTATANTSSTQPPTSKLTPKTARESSTMKPSPQKQAPTKKSISSKTEASVVTSNPSKTSKQVKKDESTTTSHSNTSVSEGITVGLFKHASNFPPVFMVILVVIVAIYFGYHHRNKLHNFIKEGLSQPKQHRGPGYLKVKVEDDTINLPREANREYIY